MSERPGAKNTANANLANRKARTVAAALAVYAIGMPLVISMIMATYLPPGSPPLLGSLALGVVMLGPGIAAIVVMLRGLDTIAREFTEFPDNEPQQIVIHVFGHGVVFAYIVGLFFAGIAPERLLPLFAVSMLGLPCGWLLFVHLIVQPKPSTARRGAAIVTDIAFLSIYLHIGGELAAPWFAMYLWVIIGFGFRFGLRPLFASSALSLLSFSVVFVSTPYWNARPEIAAGAVAAILLLPAYAASLIRRLTAAKAQAEEANAAKTRFFAIMSHELRTPLNSVIGMGTIFSRTSLDAEQRDMLGTIQLAARTLLGLINDILDFSKIEAGKLQPEIESFALHEVLGGAVAMLRPQAEAKGLALLLRIDPRLPHAYRGLPLQLRQILINLIANAIKFTPQGRIAVSARFIEREADIIRMQLAVRDDGIGIEPGARNKIFDVFTQADSTVTRRYGGTGLGLAIAKQLTQLMGGTIEVESEPGKGSTFTVGLSLQHDPMGMGRPPDLAGRAVFLVTADANLATMLQESLRAWRGEVQWLTGGEAALQNLAKQSTVPRALLLLDGRDDPLAALSVAHRLASGADHPPLTLFIAPPGGGDSIAGLAAAQLAAVVEAPLGEAALASGLLAALAVDVRAVDAVMSAPRRPEAASSSSPASSPPLPAPARSLKVLIAEDNGANRKILKRILEIAGHQVVAVNDGEAALSTLDRDRFDLALMDINMPEMSGYEVTKLYRVAHLGDDHLPIIALTADATSETERQCREAGMDAVLTKPVDVPQLLAAIDETYGRLATSSSALASPVVTPISAHPRFFSDTGAIVDEPTIEALKMLGGTSDFLGDVIETFCADGRLIMEHLHQAVSEGDLRAFKDLTHSLRSGAANVGAARLCQTLTTLREVTGRDLRQHGKSYVEKLQSEFTKLEAALGHMASESGNG